MASDPPGLASPADDHATPRLGCDAIGACGGLSAILSGDAASPDVTLRLDHRGGDAQRGAGRRDTPFDRPPRLI